jgi:hypothetical protein
MKLSVRLGGVEESDMQPGAGIALDNLLALASLKFGSLKRMVVCGLFSGLFSDSLGTAVDGLRGFCLVAAAAGGGGRGFGWRKMGVSVESRMKSRSVGMIHLFTYMYRLYDRHAVFPSIPPHCCEFELRVDDAAVG